MYKPYLKLGDLIIFYEMNTTAGTLRDRRLRVRQTAIGICANLESSKKMIFSRTHTQLTMSNAGFRESKMMTENHQITVYLLCNTAQHHRNNTCTPNLL